ANDPLGAEVHVAHEIRVRLGAPLERGERAGALADEARGGVRGGDHPGEQRARALHAVFCLHRPGGRHSLGKCPESSAESSRRANCTSAIISAPSGTGFSCRIRMSASTALWTTTPSRARTSRTISAGARATW